MKPTIKIATTPTPDGGEMDLYQHDRDFFIRINGKDLMHSRHYESERELARLGCMHLGARKAPSILIGGLGMGYTLRHALDILPLEAQVVVSELMEGIVVWNRKFFSELNRQPLSDERVHLKRGDVVTLIKNSPNTFDTILLDIDNGPDAMTDANNGRLYSYEGIQACRKALRKNGCIALWSSATSKKFEKTLRDCDLHACRYRVPAHKGSKSQSRSVWVACGEKSMLPTEHREPLHRFEKKSKAIRVKSSR